VTPCSGFYFLGLWWMFNLRSNLFGVGEDAAYIAEHRTPDTCREVCTDAV
jgi:hypothetical protein